MKYVFGFVFDDYEYLYPINLKAAKEFGGIDIVDIEKMNISKGLITQLSSTMKKYTNQLYSDEMYWDDLTWKKFNDKVEKLYEKLKDELGKDYYIINQFNQ